MNAIEIEKAQVEAKFINHEMNEHQKLAVDAGAEANETQRMLAGQLILIAGTVITVSAVFLNTDHGNTLGLHSKALLIGSWIAFAVSISSGILGLVLDSEFFVSWQKYHFGIAVELGTSKYTSLTIQKARNKNPLPKARSPVWPLYGQIGLLALGGLTFLALIIHLQLIK